MGKVPEVQCRGPPLQLKQRSQCTCTTWSPVSATLWKKTKQRRQRRYILRGYHQQRRRRRRYQGRKGALCTRRCRAHCRQKHGGNADTVCYVEGRLVVCNFCVCQLRVFSGSSPSTLPQAGKKACSIQVYHGQREWRLQHHFRFIQLE